MTSQNTFDCTPKCVSKTHIQQLISAITKTSEPCIINFITRCHNAAKSYDTHGRTLLHAAVSCGNKTVVDWLLTQSQVRISAKDIESGWTALHRALFYGHLDIGLQLIQNNADINLKDREFLTPFEIVLKDRPAYIEFTNTGLNEVYGWGANTNSTLGLENLQSAKQPEQVDFFRREKISITAVSMNTFHTIFLRNTGLVYVCGHGQDGRLGLGSERSVLTPTLVSAIQNEKCIQVSASLNQSYFLMESGNIYSCGLNTFNQLVHYQPTEKSLTPKLMNLKMLKINKINGIWGLKYHSVIYADNNLFTWGLNAGQMGHIKVSNDSKILIPRLVSQIVKGETFSHVSFSDHVTAVLTSRGDLYIMQDYVCKKVAHRLLDISRMCISGGRLDPSVDPDKSKFSSPVIVVYSNTVGKLFIWNSDTNLIRSIQWNQQRSMKIAHFCLGMHRLVAATTDGDCFICTIPNDFPVQPFAICRPTKLNDSLVGFEGKSLNTLVAEMDCINLSLQKVPLAYRVNLVFCDPRGLNVVLLQASPNASLNMIPVVSDSMLVKEIQDFLLQSDEEDSTYDVILKFNSQDFNCHKYILSQKSVYFKNLFSKESAKTLSLSINMAENTDKDDSSKDQICKQIANNSYMLNQDVTTYQICLSNTSNIIFKQFLLFLYTGSCDFTRVGSNLAVFCNHKDSQDKMNSDKKSKKNGKNVVKVGNLYVEVANQLKYLARIFSSPALIKCMERFDYSNSYVRQKSEVYFEEPFLTFDFTDDWAIDLSDISIETKEKNFDCHKCILVARVEYFKGMLSCNWMGSDFEKHTVVKLPIEAKVLQLILEYVYTDSCSGIKDCEDVEFLCKLLSASDQFLLRRLQELIEVILAQLITLKNVSDLLELAMMCNSFQLGETCMQFICHNLIEIFEMRLLDTLSKEVFQKLSLFYRQNTNGMSSRMMTAYSDWPPLSLIENIDKNISFNKPKRLKTKSETLMTVLNDNNESQPIKTESIDLKENECFKDSIDTHLLNTKAELNVTWTKINTKPNKKINKKSLGINNDSQELTKEPKITNSNNIIATVAQINNINKSGNNALVGFDKIQLNGFNCNSEDYITKNSDNRDLNVVNKSNEWKIASGKDKHNNDLKKSENNMTTNNLKSLNGITVNQDVMVENKKTQSSIFEMKSPRSDNIPFDKSNVSFSKDTSSFSDSSAILLNEIIENKIELALKKNSSSVVQMPKKKLSQKQRKEEQKQSENILKSPTINGKYLASTSLDDANKCGSFDDDSMASSPIQACSPPSSVWHKSPVRIESFKDLMINELTNLNQNSLVLSNKSQSKETMNADAAAKWLEKDGEATTSNVSFKKIMEEETKTNAYLASRRKTNLQHVLIEERALQELQNYYNEQANCGEYVTVERVVAMNMTPLWSAHQK